MQLACFPWYDLDEVRPAHDSLWAAVAAQLRARGLPGVPDRLERGVDYETQWHSGKLLLGQACGYDAILSHADALRIVATPHFDFDGCEGPRYRSFVVVREDCNATRVSQLRDLRCVINTPTSHSGMNVLRSLVAPLHVGGRFFSEIMTSGAHEASLRMLRGGKADVAAIDCITHGLLQRVRPSALAGTRVVCRTVGAPAPPYVTSRETPDEVVGLLRQALHAVLRDPRLTSVTSHLGLAGLSWLDEEAYEPIADLAHSARALDYREFGVAAG